MTCGVPAAVTSAAPSAQLLDDRPESGRRRLRWWHEVIFAAAFYAVYSVIRNTQGSASVSPEIALRNAIDIVDLEKVLGLYREEAFQQLFLGWKPLMVFWNLFYGTFHFVVTGFVLVVLFRRHPEGYRRWRNALAVATAFALVGFAMYPLMPPRLLPARFGFVDSLRVYGSLWTFDSTAMHKISNQYAAMPSLHFAWALWCACALYPVLSRPWSKALAVLYPIVTLLAIVITANHFVLDAAAGALVLGVGWLAALGISIAGARRTSRRATGGGGRGAELATTADSAQ